MRSLGAMLHKGEHLTYTCQTRFVGSLSSHFSETWIRADIRRSKSKMLGTLFTMTALLLVAVAQTAAAQRGDTSICDYYAKELYGDSSMESQLKLMTSIVAFAYAGGDDMDGADKNSSGIFKAGSIDNDVVYLRPYFDGTSRRQP